MTKPPVHGILDLSKNRRLFYNMYNYIVKVRDTRRDEYRIILTPKLIGKNEARDFVKKQAGFDKSSIP